MAKELLAIGGVVDAVEQALAPLFAGRQRDITEENIQARARGLLLMAVSNKFGGMVVTTGNKAEVSVGYATLYGDMCGGYSVLKDLYKTEVYALAEWRNRCVPEGALGPSGEVVPRNVLTKAPTAERITSAIARLSSTAGTCPSLRWRSNSTSGAMAKDISTASARGISTGRPK